MSTVNRVSFLLKKTVFLLLKMFNKIVLLIANMILVAYDMLFLAIKVVCTFFKKNVKSLFFIIRKYLYVVFDFYKKDMRILAAYVVALIAIYKVMCLFYLKPESSCLGEKNEFSVLAREVKSEQIEKVVNCYGNVESENSIQYVSEVNGTISNIFVKKKSRVKKGQLLMVIDSKTLKEAYVGAKSSLEVKNIQFNAIKKLYKEGLESVGNLRTVQADLENARSTFEKIKKSYKGLNIYAPFDGYIDNIDYKEYSQVDIGQPLFTLEQTDSLKIESDLRSIYADELEIGNDVGIFIGGSHVANGKIVNVSENIDVLTGNKVISIGNITINDGYEKIVKPGISVKIKIAIKLKRNLYKISSESLLVSDSGDFFVKTIDKRNGEVSAKNVVVYDDRDGYEYVSGVDEHDLIIERGSEFVKLGEKNVKYRLISEKKHFNEKQDNKESINNEEDNVKNKVDDIKVDDVSGNETKTTNGLNNADIKSDTYKTDNAFIYKIYFKTSDLCGRYFKFCEKQFKEIKNKIETRITNFIKMVSDFLGKKE